MTRTRTRIAATLIAAAGVAALGATSAQAAAPDTDCQRAGMNFLKDNGLFSAVARDGITVGTAVSVGVGVRGDNPVPPLDTVLSLSTVLADHRAGDNSYFTYPWCG